MLGAQLPPPPPPPQLPLLQPLLLRRASISSLDESSQKCDENGGNGSNGGCSKAGFMLETPGGAGGRPTYREEEVQMRSGGLSFELLILNLLAYELAL